MTQNYSRDFCRSGRPTTIQYSSSRNQFQTFLEGKLVVGCLWLQHMLRGIKHHQGSKHQHESITIELMHIIFQSLNFYKPYNTLGCLLSRVFWILTPLNRQRLTSSIQSILSAAGVPHRYTGHSFCIVGTTISAASCGLPDHLTKTLSKWFRIRIRSICTPITTIVGVASQLTWQVLLAHLSSFLVVFVGCLRTLVVRGQDFPQLWAPLSLSKLVWVAPRVPSAWNGGS